MLKHKVKEGIRDSPCNSLDCILYFIPQSL